MPRRSTRGEGVEFEDSSRAEIDEAPEGVGRRGRRPRRPWDTEDESTAAILPIYLREMGANSLIRESKEVELARGLQEAREALAKLALRLPAPWRNYALAGDIDGPQRGRAWPLDRVESFYQRFLCYAREHPDVRSANIVREAKEQKRRMDRAREALIVANLRLVIYLAKKYLRHGMSFMDLIQEGNIGLMKAVEKFEYERGNKFSTYAYWWIKQAVERAIADKARLIRIPVHVNEKMRKIYRVAGELEDGAGRRARAEEIATAVGMPVEKVEEILGVVREPQALEDFASEDESPGLLGTIVDQSSASAIEHVEDHELREKIEKTLRILTPREAVVLRMRFGIGREMAHTLEEIGQTLRLSRERVRQIEAGALRKIQAARESRDLKDYVV